MNDNRRQILEMLSAGKITADEAERLLAALDPGPAPVCKRADTSKGWGYSWTGGSTIQTPCAHPSYPFP